MKEFIGREENVSISKSILESPIVNLYKKKFN